MIRPSVRNARPHRRGFTLVEVVVALVLTTLLLGVILAATASLSRDRRRLDSASAASTPADLQALLALLRHDLANARSFTSSADGQTLTVVGHGGLSPATLSPVGRLVEVTYRVSSSKDRGTGGVLVRQQRPLDDAARQTPWSELVAVGVTRLDVTAASPDEGTLPPAVRVQATLRDRVLDEVIWLR